MEFTRSVELSAPIEDAWALVTDVPAAASCIPGVSDVQMTDTTAFTCKLSQRVGSAKANFDLKSDMTIDESGRSVVVKSSGRDRALGSTVSATQTFVFSETGAGATTVLIDADIQMTGRIATFGHRIIATKAEQVTVEAIKNVDDLLAGRRSG
jgi:carbon monoxide dehydrogenase subunit G